MEKTIWKFEIQITYKQHIKMPKGAEILSVQVQNGIPYLWALVDPDAEIEERCIEVFGIGNPIQQFSDTQRKYVGTFQMHFGKLVWHLFERLY